MEGSDEFGVAVEAYVYAYPLVTMEMTRRVITNVAEPKGTKGPMGQLIKLREYPNASFRDVTAPNADTLYTTAFLDVGDEPWIVSLPDLDDRYALFPMLDGWTTVFDVPGKRTTGTGAQTFAVTGPGWEGTLPEGVTQYKSPTSIVWLLGRIYCTGTPEDYAAVHKIQDEVKLYPLSAWGKEWTPPAGKVDPSIDMKTPVRDQVNKMDAVEYFTLFADLLKRNPPYAADAPMLEKLAQIGILPGQDFDKSKFDPAFAKRVPQIAFAKIMLHFKFSDGDVQDINGWGFATKDRHLRDQLYPARAHHRDRPRRQPAAGRDLSNVDEVGERGDQAQIRRLGKNVYDLQEGPDAARLRFLVVDHVRRELFLHRQSAKPLFDQRTPAAEGQRRRVDRFADPESIARGGQGIQLASRAEGKIHPDDAAVLARRNDNPSIIDGSWTIPPVTKVG